MISWLRNLSVRGPVLLVGIGLVTLLVAPLTFVGLSIPAFIREELSLFEITALTVTLVQTVVIAALGVGSLLIAAGSLNRQAIALEEAHRPVIDVRLKPYDRERSDERSVWHEFAVQNFGAGAALDTYVISLVDGQFSQRVGGQSVAAGETANLLETASQGPHQRERIWEKPFELVAVYRDVFGNWWRSGRSYAAYPGKITALQVRALNDEDKRFLLGGETGAWTADETPPF